LLPLWLLLLLLLLLYLQLVRHLEWWPAEHSSS
jgi:hypothetical protein